MQWLAQRLLTLVVLLHIATIFDLHVEALGTEQPCNESRVPAQLTKALAQTRPLTAAEECAAICRRDRPDSALSLVRLACANSIQNSISRSAPHLGQRVCCGDAFGACSRRCNSIRRVRRRCRGHERCNAWFWCKEDGAACWERQSRREVGPRRCLLLATTLAPGPPPAIETVDEEPFTSFAAGYFVAQGGDAKASPRLWWRRQQRRCRTSAISGKIPTKPSRCTQRAETHVLLIRICTNSEHCDRRPDRLQRRARHVCCACCTCGCRAAVPAI